MSITQKRQLDWSIPLKLLTTPTKEQFGDTWYDLQSLKACALNLETNKLEEVSIYPPDNEMGLFVVNGGVIRLYDGKLIHSPKCKVIATRRQLDSRGK